MSFQAILCLVLAFGSGAKSELSAADGYAFTDVEYKNDISHYVFFEILAPEELRYSYKINRAAFSPPFHTSVVTGLVISDPLTGCGQQTNPEHVAGNVLLIERGECSFVSKTVRAMEAGAIGAIVTDNDPNDDDAYISMVDDLTGRNVSIPCAFIVGKSGYIIRRTMERRQIDKALIRIPINITYRSIREINQPKWLTW